MNNILSNALNESHRLEETVPTDSWLRRASDSSGSWKLTGKLSSCQYKHATNDDMQISVETHFLLFQKSQNAFISGVFRVQTIFIIDDRSIPNHHRSVSCAPAEIGLSLRRSTKFPSVKSSIGVLAYPDVVIDFNGPGIDYSIDEILSHFILYPVGIMVGSGISFIVSIEGVLPEDYFKS